MIGKTKRKKKMIGMSNFSLRELFDKQKANQELMISKGLYDIKGETSLPVDDVKLSSYHILQLMSELGEVLEADKRWKNFRNKKYDKSGKTEEIADCFIVLMNVAMFSGIDAEELFHTINAKIDKVHQRVEKDIN